MVHDRAHGCVRRQWNDPCVAVGGVSACHAHVYTCMCKHAWAVLTLGCAGGGAACREGGYLGAKSVLVTDRGGVS